MATQNGRDLTLYGGQDPRDLPAYPLDVAASILLLPKSTLKLWVFGDTWKEKSGIVRSFAPLIDPPDRDQHTLSFVNLVEAHVLKSLRRKHRVQMIQVRDAIEILKLKFDTLHPLADVDLLAGGARMYIDEVGQLLNVGMGNQIGMDFLRVYLARIDRNLDAISGANPALAPAIRLYPFVIAPVQVGKRKTAKLVSEDRSKLISIDPYVYFGRPVIAGTGIPTEAIAERFWGGDSIPDVVRDFERSQAEIEYAIRYEYEQLAVAKARREPPREMAA